MKTLNSIAMEYLLRTDSQKNTNREEQTIQAAELNMEHMKGQKSLLFQMYDLEEEDYFA